MIKQIGIASALSMSLWTMAMEPASIKQEVKPIINAFAGDLQSELVQAIQMGGTVSGIEVCNVQGPNIAVNHSQSDWTISRTSLKFRNPDNRPDEWETQELVKFEEAQKAGSDIANMWAVYQDSKEIRVMKAIPIKGVCLACHGTNLAPEVSSRLESLYPDDRATGYQQGEVRGAFSLIKRKL